MIASRALLILLLAPGLASFAEPRVVASTVLRDDPALAVHDGVLYWRAAPFDGTLTGNNSDVAAPRTATTYRDGRRDGWARAWYPDGRLAWERRYVRGREAGEHRGWWPDGRPQFASHYHDGLIEGTAREWFANGQLYRESHYAAGQESGTQRLWYADGSLRANYVVRDGRRFGLPGTKGCSGLDSRAVPGAR